MNPTSEEHLNTGTELVIPSRLDSTTFHPIKKRFSNKNLVLLAEDSVDICPEVMRLLGNEQIEAFSFSLNDDPVQLGNQLRAQLAPDSRILYIPAIRSVLEGTAAQINTSALDFLCKLGFPVTPIGVHYPQESTLAVMEAEEESLFHLEETLHPNELSPARIRQSFYSAIEQCFARRRFSRASLGSLVIRSLKANPQSKLIDGSDDSELTYDKLLAAAMVFADKLKKLTTHRRVAIALPPGKAGTIVNIATVIANKIPVNLNFTASRSSIESAVRQSATDLMITASALKSKCPDFPWDLCKNECLVDQEFPTLKNKIKFTFLFNKVRSADSIIKTYQCQQYAGEKEAVLLFTSGSSGEPKGVPLSHKNIISNISQSAYRLGLREQSTLLGCLPLFHSFGMTWTMWFPLLAGHNLVTFTSPLETKRLAELIDTNSVQMLVATPTFLRGYLRRAKAEQLDSLSLVITGAEKLPTALADQFEKKFHIRPLEGYGLTETSPGTHVNLPQSYQDPTLPTNKPQSVGQPLPGLAMRIASLDDTDHPDPREQGEIQLKGPNVFNGYLNKPALNAEILQDGWFRTGDIGLIDDDGFLHIKGRLSRFSKIAGEMVPHEVVEEAILKILQLEDSDERCLAIMGVPDEQKGEKLILLSSVEVQTHEIKIEMVKQGMPALWAPKEVIQVDQIPILASGKLDIKSCKELV